MTVIFNQASTATGSAGSQ